MIRVRFELLDDPTFEAFNATVLDFRDGSGFVSAVTVDDRPFLGVHIGAGRDTRVAMLDQDDVRKLARALGYACEAHGGHGSLGVLSW